MAGSGTGGDERAGGRTGRHAAPRHSGRSADPVLDTSQLPTLPVEGAPAPVPPPATPTGRGATKDLLLLALGITAAVVAWGYLVFLAIDFGTSARQGEARGWWLLALASVGAIACLFAGLLLVSRLVARLKASAPPPTPPRPQGGRRAAR